MCVQVYAGQGMSIAGEADSAPLQLLDTDEQALHAFGSNRACRVSYVVAPIQSAADVAVVRNSLDRVGPYFSRDWLLAVHVARACTTTGCVSCIYVLVVHGSKM
jgi:hypothetical protein